MFQYIGTPLPLLPILILFVFTALVESKERKQMGCDKAAGEQSVNYLSTKRPYSYDSKLAEKSRYVPSGCTAERFWYFGRHGTRKPGKDDMKLMNTILPTLHKEIMTGLSSGRGQLCPELRAALGSWNQSELNISEASFLAPQGEQELFGIGARYKNRFPSLFKPNFQNSSYFIKYTDSQRTGASARAFAKGIFGTDEAKNVWMPTPIKVDPVLKFYDDCPKYTKKVDEDPEGNEEHAEFVVSKAMNSTILRVSKRLGLAQGADMRNETQRLLTLEEITLLYTTCGFETAWKNGMISPWCHAFDAQDLEVMEYAEDLEYYWKDGYGHKINYKQACVPFKDAVEFFNTYVANPRKEIRKVQAYFSHSGATLKMLARLDMYNSGEINSDNFKKEKGNYEWRTSKIDTMASNLAFTLYKCPKKRGDKKYQIGFFFQEIPTPFPACDNKPFCSYEKFKKEMDFVDDCNLSQICKI